MAGDDFAKDAVTELDQLKAERATTDALVQEIRDHVLPVAGPITGIETPGTKQGGRVFDSTGEQANEMAAAGIYGLMTNPATRWFALSTGDAALDREKDVAEWLAAETEGMLADLRRGKAGAFAAAQWRFNLELVCFGTATKWMWPAAYNLPRWRHCPFGSVWIAENDEGAVDTWFRCFDLSARQAHARWGERAGPSVMKCLEKEPHRKFTFLHLTRPNRDRKPDRFDRANMAFETAHVALEDKTTIERGGTHEARYVTARMLVRGEAGSSEVYGRGPGHKALADIKMLQEQRKLTLRADQMATYPPQLVPHDGIVGPFSLRPAAINYHNAEPGMAEGFKPLNSGVRPERGDVAEEKTRELIWEAFWRSTFLSMRQFTAAYSRPPTATEVLEMREEQMRILGPIFGQLQAEDLEPTLEQLMAMRFRTRRAAPMPERLAALADFKPVFLNPVSQAQRLADVRGIQRTMEAVAPFAQVNPAVLDRFDDDRSAAIMAAAYQYPPEAMRSDEQVAAMRRARQEEAAKAAALQEAGAVAGIAGQAASVIPALKDLGADAGARAA